MSRIYYQCRRNEEGKMVCYKSDYGFPKVDGFPKMEGFRKVMIDKYMLNLERVSGIVSQEEAERFYLNLVLHSLDPTIIEHTGEVETEAESNEADTVERGRCGCWGLF
jgi:hypothetical protein